MPFSSGVFTRVYSWVSDKNSSIDITASRMDTEDTGFATGLSTCLLKDGTQTVTANIPMSTYKFTGLGAGSANTDSATVGQIQNSTVNWVASGGTADAITATYAPAVTALVDGMELDFRATGANTTTTPTFSPNGLTARTITQKGGSALGVGSIPAALFEAKLRYNLANTRWELLNPVFLGGNMTSAVNFATAVTVASATSTDVGAAASNTVIISGTTTITSFASAAVGIIRTIYFSGSLLLTHSAGFFLPTAANITTNPNDTMVAYSNGAGAWTILSYQRTNGRPLAGGIYDINSLSTITIDPAADYFPFYDASGATVGKALISALTATSYQASPADPTGTANTTGLMMGLAGAITPTKSGKVLIIISGDVQNSTGGANQMKLQARYGTGTAPVNAAALTGTAVGGLVNATDANNAYPVPFSLNAIVSGLTVGVAIWIDIGLAAIAGGTASAKNISISAVEL